MPPCGPLGEGENTALLMAASVIPDEQLWMRGEHASMQNSDANVRYPPSEACVKDTKRHV
jgi:hypothetical protein